MGLFASLRDAISDDVLHEEDDETNVTVNVGTDSKSDAGEDAGAVDEVEAAVEPEETGGEEETEVEADVTVEEDDDNVNMDVNEKPDNPLTPNSGVEAAPDSGDGNADIQANGEKEMLDKKEVESPAEAEDAFGTDDPEVKVEEEEEEEFDMEDGGVTDEDFASFPTYEEGTEDPGAIHNQELDPDTAPATDAGMEVSGDVVDDSYGAGRNYKEEESVSESFNFGSDIPE